MKLIASSRPNPAHYAPTPRPSLRDRSNLMDRAKTHRMASRVGMLAGAGTPLVTAPEDGNNPQPPLDEYYNSLFTALGPQHWWPGKTQFEVIVGAILTQNTAWTNVERAIANLREAGLLRPDAIEKVPLQR